MEIEKKFKVKYLPEHLDQYSFTEIEQGYLCSTPIVRIRRSGSDYFLTCKSKFLKEEHAALCCEEYEMPLTEDAYLHLREKIDFFLIWKTRYFIPLEQGLVAELDLFHGSLEGLKMVEVEFSDKESAAKFSPPLWFDQDVSMDERYQNKYLAKLVSVEGY